MSLVLHVLKLVRQIARLAMLAIFYKDRIALNVIQFVWPALVPLPIAHLALVAII